MGSTFTTMPGKYDHKGIFGKKKLPIYMQFVPGVVVSVVTSMDSDEWNKTRRRINSIKALPHITDGIKKETMIGEDNRYYPLLRGIQETPTKGDPVLLCTVGGVNYYLGPLNTAGNPNFNVDNFKTDEVKLNFEDKEGPTVSIKNNPNFVRQSFSRLQKLLNPELDKPLNVDVDTGKEIHGDLVLEGRHGNSLRIGSRNVNPYIIISNGRSASNIVESSLDGSILALFKHGSIRTHFKMDRSLDLSDREKPVLESYKFTLADGELDSVYSSISDTFASSLGNGQTADVAETLDVTPVLYHYSGSQMFQSSDRITINAKVNKEYTDINTGQLSGCMFLSAGNFMHFGSGNTMTFSTSNNLLMNVSRDTTINSTTEFNVNTETLTIDGTERINLGDILKGDVMQAAAKGETLLWMLRMLIMNINTLCDQTAGCIEGRSKKGASVGVMQKVKKDFDKWSKDLDAILSDKVYLK